MSNGSWRNIEADVLETCVPVSLIERRVRDCTGRFMHVIGLVCNDRYLHLSRTIFLIGPRDSLYVRICTPGVADVGLSRLLGLVAVASLLKRHGASCGDLRVNSMNMSASPF